ncbi:helix-turn-helix domain-containing protein [Idiomarina sp. PL1-037]|uniref:helix-turn-helix transcriptional regulator n=1 Tax=Idiomarina sp. PL1-037 TaxID=3095365 RepID=UPI002ACC0AEC|nr:helix-turn-helix domain-containing protein [Idiomarina sp. PL1-037]WQC54194.1 helix-turn-helix domain-containing protein [Idiomarina sp. PL1-037]
MAQNTYNKTPESDLLRPKQAAAYLNLHRVTLYKLSERDPSFPRKLKAGERLCYYRKSDLDSWLQSLEV